MAGAVAAMGVAMVAAAAAAVVATIESAADVHLLARVRVVDAERLSWTANWVVLQSGNLTL